MNNDRYTYGYNLGWNESNEYLESFFDIFDKYEEQKKVLKDLKLNSMVNTNIKKLTDEEIKNTYDEFYTDSLMSFEKFKSNLLQEQEKTNNMLKQYSNQNIEKYNSNLYYLIDIKQSTIKLINAKIKELEYELQQNEIDIKQQSLYFAYLNKIENASEIKNKLDNLFLKNKKLKHAISVLKDKKEEMNLTREENELLLKGLNDREKKYYNEIKNIKNKEKYVPPVLEIKTFETKPEQIEDYTTDYQKRLDKYHEGLKKYENDCSIILKMYEQVLNGEISKEEFESFEAKIKQEYTQIKEEYDNFINYRENILNDTKEGKIWHPSLNDNQIAELNNLNILKPDGELYKKYLTENGLTLDYINEPKEPIDFRDLLNDLAREYDIQEKNNKFIDISKIINKVRGDYEPSLHYEFVNKLNKIKVLNVNKFKERTLIDIPMRLVRGIIGTSARGISKLYGKIVYSLSPKLRSKMEEMTNKVNDLTEEEIDYIATCFRDGDVMSQYRKMLPDSIWNLILQRIFEKNYDEVIKGNFNIQLMHENLLNLYSEMKNSLEKINSGNITEEEISDLKEAYERDNELVINIIKNMEFMRSKVGMLLNPTGGVRGFEENWKAAMNQITGGKKNSMKDSLELLNFSGEISDKLEKAISKNDGLRAAELFIYREKVRIDHDKKKRTLKNLGGYSQVGEWEWKPFAQEVDYREHHPIQDFLRSTAIALSIYNVMNQIELRTTVSELQKECQRRGYIIGSLQQQNQNLITQIKNLQGKYTADPVQFEQEYYNVCQQTVGYGSQTVEVIAQKNAAGAAGSNSPILDVSNKDYSSIDSIGHAQSSYIDNLKSIHNNSSLSEMQKVSEFDKVMQNYYNEMSNVTLNAKQNLIKFMSSSSFDHTTLKEVINQAGKVDPKITSDVYRELMAIIKDINDIDLTNKISAVLNNVTAEVDLLPAIATCAGIIGSATIDNYYESKRRKIDRNESQKKKNNLWKLFRDIVLDIHDKTELEQATDDLKEKYQSKKVDLYEEAREEYNRRLEEWNSRGPLDRILHRKEKPNELETQIEILERRSR